MLGRDDTRRGVLLVDIANSEEIIHFPSALNEKLSFDLKHLFVKIKSISPPETIANAIGKIIHVAKGPSI